MTAEVGIPPGSNAVLIGVSAYEYAEFPPIRAARHSLDAMHALLSDAALCRWPSERITVISNPLSAAELAAKVADLAESTTGVLLLYYVGHGTLSVRGELCLTVTSTRPNRPKITGLPWDTFADVLRECPAKTRLVVLDCCFAGQAIEALDAGGDSGLGDITHVDGVYVLAATTRNRTAHVPPPDQQDFSCTSFTGELRNLIQSGIVDKPPWLTFNDIYPALRQRLLARGLPAPSQRGYETAHQFPFTANAAVRSDTALRIVRPPPSPRNILPLQRKPPVQRSYQSGSGVVGLAARLRDLREREFVRLTQTALGRAIGDTWPVSATTISSWENPVSGRLIPLSRVEAYARLFCTPRSFEGDPHMLGDAELTQDELRRYVQLKEELSALREIADSQGELYPGDAQSMWHFLDGSRVTLVCSRLPPERRPPSSNPKELDYIRFSDLADLGALFDIYGAVRAYNPTSQVVITAAEDLTHQDVASHLVLIGGLAWEIVARLFSRIFWIPIQAGDPAERGAIVVNDPDSTLLEFRYELRDDVLVEDIGFFVRGENPAASQRTLTICGGITAQGVRGAARCFIDDQMREHNEQFLRARFPEGSTYCIVMRVPVVGSDPLTPDLSRAENRLFEWSGMD